MTREDDIWFCLECGTEHGRHDMWFDGICGNCESKKLTSEETERVQKFCDVLRLQVKREMGLNRISGGFCNVEFDSCNGNSIFLLVKYGTSDEGGSYVATDSYELDRDDFSIVNENRISTQVDGIEVKED